jgi:GTP-binding protein
VRAGLPRVAVVGRQNVGKSTLVNRLFGRREAIADEAPGVTRDRVEVETTWRGRRFALVDTGGFVRGARTIEALVAEQAQRAAEHADLVLLVVDAQTGIREEDEALARRLRRSSVPAFVVANKVDGERDEADAAAFVRLGLGEPMLVSALHGRGSGDLLDRIVSVLPDNAGLPEGGVTEPRFAVVGRANVGKSSLFNRLVGEERSVVYAEAGTTRDAVDAVVEWPAGPVRFVDTAGFRRSSKRQGIEYYGFLRAVHAIERSDVAAVVIDATQGLTTEDRRIAARVLEFRRGLIVVANKWDLVEEKDRIFKELQQAVEPFARAQVVRTSALRGTGVHRLPDSLLSLHERWSRRVPTARVNEVVRRAQDERPPPRGAGRVRYATQVAAGPPALVLFGGATPDHSYRRYLENRVRRELGFEGVPLKLSFRVRGSGRGRGRGTGSEPASRSRSDR